MHIKTISVTFSHVQKRYSSNNFMVQDFLYALYWACNIGPMAMSIDALYVCPNIFCWRVIYLNFSLKGRKTGLRWFSWFRVNLIVTGSITLSHNLVDCYSFSPFFRWTHQVSFLRQTDRLNCKWSRTYRQITLPPASKSWRRHGTCPVPSTVVSIR